MIISGHFPKLLKDTNPQTQKGPKFPSTTDWGEKCTHRTIITKFRRKERREEGKEGRREGQREEGRKERKEGGSKEEREGGRYEKQPERKERSPKKEMHSGCSARDQGKGEPSEHSKNSQ